jgi:deoxyribonuclease V
MDVKKLYKEQSDIAKRSVLTDSIGDIKRIGGVDCSYLGDEYIVAGLVVLDYGTMRPIYRTFDRQRLTFPYIPGLLAFREAAAMMGVLQKAKIRPDLAMIDGFGTNHPRRCGIATHIGVKLGIPTIGMGKSFLCGRIEGDDIYQDGEKVGRLIFSKGSKRPIYVSPGHKVSLDNAVNITVASIRHGKLPEPTRLAHEYVTGLKQKLSVKK